MPPMLFPFNFQGMTFVREHLSSGKGPMYVEFDTYRYHGHSMSDPGTTYRTREEVGSVRQARDPIEYVKKLISDHELLSADEIKVIEKEVRDHVAESLVRAKAGGFPVDSALYKDVYSTKDHVDEPQKFVRMPDYHKSIYHNV
jgi:pyruvate dehydrogenase E1 component alpha subunit